MKNLNVPSSNLSTANNSNITFNGLCTPNSFDISTDKMFTQEVINDFITVPGQEEVPIKSIVQIDVESNILNHKVIETPGSSTSNSVSSLGNKKITGKEISISGVICLDITYAGNDPASTNITFQGKLPFTSYIVVPKTTSLTDKFQVSCCVQNINVISIYNFIITASASFTLSAKKIQNLPLVTSTCSCSSSNPLTVIGATPGNILKNLIISSDKIWNQVSFSTNLILPGNFPNAKSVSSIFSTIKIISQSIVDLPSKTPPISNYYGENVLGKKLIVEAVLNQRINYSADNENSTLHSRIINLPVSCYIMLPNNTDLNQKFKIEAYIEDLYSCCVDERTLFSGAILFFKAKEIINCVPFYPNRNCCSCSDNFNIQYNLNNLCNMNSISQITATGSWSESTISKRIYASLDAPIRFVRSASSSIKIISIDTIETPNSNRNLSIEGFLLPGFTSIVNGALVTTITYNSSNDAGSVVTNTFYISFSEFIILNENPSTSNKTVAITPCIENFSVNVLDETGIGIYAQVFLNAKLISNN